MSFAQSVVIASYVFVSLATFWTILRCVCRFILVRRPWVDDYLSILAVLCSIVFGELQHTLSLNGLGQSITALDFPTLVRFLYLFYIAASFYTAAAILIKCSALCQYLRFIPPGRVRRFCWFVLAFNIMFGISAMLADALACRPIQFAWNKAIPGGTCIDVFKFWYGASAVHITTDFVVLGIPIYLFGGLNLPSCERAALIGTFMTAGLACITAVVRVYAVYLLASMEQDIPKYTPLMGLTCMLEINLGIIGICTPTLKPLIVKLCPRLLVKKQQQQQQPRHGTPREIPLHQQIVVHGSHSSQANNSVDSEKAVLCRPSVPGLKHDGLPWVLSGPGAVDRGEL